VDFPEPHGPTIPISILFIRMDQRVEVIRVIQISGHIFINHWKYNNAAELSSAEMGVMS
jgi:hypothetical protein